LSFEEAVRLVQKSAASRGHQQSPFQKPGPPNACRTSSIDDTSIGRVSEEKANLIDTTVFTNRSDLADN
jgi:hypothetical protein